MFELFIALRYLRRRQGKGPSGIALIGIGGVFVGVAATLIVLSVMNGFHQELRTRILGVTPHIMISRVFNDPIENYDSLARIVRTVPGVKEVAPFIYTKTMVRSRTNSDGVILRGIIAEEEEKIVDLSRHMKQGKFDFANNGLVLGNELALNLGVGVGDTLSVVSPLEATNTPLGMLPRIRKFRVNGIFDAGMYEYNTTLIYLSLEELQQLLNMGKGVSGLEVRIDDLDNAARFARNLTQKLGYSYRATDWITRNHNLFTALRLEKVVTFIVLVLIVLVAALNIAGIGTGAGVIVGGVVSVLLNRYRLVQLPGDVYFIKNLPVRMQLTDFVLVCSIAILISFIATLYPAIKAARMQPVDAIRYE
jgi:lipoprotein-releasing system permease protein